RSRRGGGGFLPPGERERPAVVGAAAQAWRFRLRFSAKESLCKALFTLVNQRFYFQGAELLEWREDGRLRMGLLGDLGGEWQGGAQLEGQFGTLGEQLLTLVAIARQVVEIAAKP